MTQIYNFQHRLGGNIIPDDATVISAADEQVFMTRVSRFTRTMDYILSTEVNRQVGVTVGDYRFSNPRTFCINIYHADGHRVGGFEWINTDNEYFLGISIEFEGNYFETRFIVDSVSPIETYTKILPRVSHYPLEQLIAEMMEFVDDYGMVPNDD